MNADGYRFLAPALRAAGYRVACTDLRGHGDSDARSPSYGDEETAGDVIALIGELGGPAVVVGNSMGAGSAVLAAARRPELVSGSCWPARSSATPWRARCGVFSCARPWPGRGRLSRTSFGGGCCRSRIVSGTGGAGWGRR
jgi:pimeloyl-ACP methyl ester carboxylesterase